MNNMLLTVEDLHTYFFTYEGVARAVDGVTFSIPKGATFGLVGESGCGKSVTAYSIIRLVKKPPGKIVKGSITMGGKNLLDLSREEMRHIRGNKISMIFQEPMTSLNPVIRVGEQVAEAIRMHQNVTGKEAKLRSVEMLQKVRIPDPEKRFRQYPHQLSGGMRQRIMIAMALTCNPELLIADEPTTALDVTIQAQILSLMQDLKDDVGASILLITHDLGVIAEMAQTVAVMYTGKIVEYSNVDTLFREPKHPYTKGLMESLPKIDRPRPANKKLPTIQGLVPSLYELPAGCSFNDRCPACLEICKEKNPDLLETNSNHLVRCWKYA